MASFTLQIKHIFFGNILLIICCAFYLIWWLLAFRPEKPVGGTGWLLIPAFIAGLVSILLITHSISRVGGTGSLIPSRVILLGGPIAFVVLLVVTVLIFKRPVTTELFLIVGWATMILSEVNALYRTNMFSRNTAAWLMAVILVAAVISLVCYVLYYRLDARLSYYDGTVPLLMVACVTAVISVCMAVHSIK